MLNMAIEIARNIPYHKYRIACIVTNKRGRILSVGKNSYTKTHPRQAYYAQKSENKHKIYLHAEIDALCRCDGKPYAIYVARVNRKGMPGLAKPCDICRMAIRDMGIKKVVYTTSNAGGLMEE